MTIFGCSTGYRLSDGRLRTIYRESEVLRLPKGYKVWKVTTPKGTFFAITQGAVDRLLRENPRSQWEVFRDGAVLSYFKDPGRGP